MLVGRRGSFEGEIKSQKQGSIPAAAHPRLAVEDCRDRILAALQKDEAK